jgi:hypothetical protein
MQMHPNLYNNLCNTQMATSTLEALSILELKILNIQY